MKNYKRNRLSQYVLVALTVGMFSLTTVAYALPTGGTSTSATITNTSATQMDIAGSKANNVINWQSFSIASGETVAFDAKNYLNLVRGASKSEINGALTGGGNIYLINPNGILFGSTAQVNVGNLVASTRAITNVDADGFADSGANPLATAVSQALTLGTNYTLDGIVADSDKVSLVGSGVYNDKNVGDNKTLTFSGLTLTGTGADNYTIANTLSGNAGQITRKTITGSLASGYSFDKVYDGTTTATLGNGYTLNGVVAGDNVPLTAVKGFYDSSAVGDRTVTFSGFSINDVNYLLSMADSLSGIGKITSNGNTNNNTNGFSDHNYSDALIGVRQYY